MTFTSLNHRRALAFAAAAMLLAGPVLAREGDRPTERDQSSDVRRLGPNWQEHGQRSASRQPQRHFEERHRPIVREYYQREYYAGRHPPGWANRHHQRYDHWQYRHHGHVNHHGYFKPWRLGYPMHREVIYYEAPAQVVTYLGPPPRGHRYVQVAGDILLIAIGTTLVVDALEDLTAWR